MSTPSDVIVIGAGPVGSVAALAHARRGARVTLIEAQPLRKNRFAGELLHPPAVAALRRAGITSVPPAEDHQPNRGFAVFSDELDGPQRLEHAGDSRGITFEFNAFADCLREQATAHPLVTYLPGWRATAIDDAQVTLEGKGATRTLSAARIVAAGGRFSDLRTMLGLPDDRTPISSMAGMVLQGVTLPFEGFGHVMLGGEGPILAYRIGADMVRCIIDVPLYLKKAPDREARIWRSVERQLPEALRAPVREQLLGGHVHWAHIEVRPRAHYHTGRVALVGDAIGLVHPLTGIGMTLGFGDAVELAASDDFAAWQARRHRETLGPALLSTALYEIFALRSEPTAACRSAVYDMWQANPSIRTRTMGFLSCEDPSIPRLFGVGFQMVARAALKVASAHLAAGSVGEGASAVRRLGGLVHWLLAGAVPPLRYLPPPAATPFEHDRLHQQPVTA